MASRGLYIVLRNGKRVSSGVAGRVLPFVWKRSEVRKLAKAKGCYTVVAVNSRGPGRKVGRSCRRKRRR